MTPSTSRRCGAIAAVTSGVLLLSACGAGDGKASLRDQLPEAIRKAGVIRVGASFTAAPMIFRNPQGQPDGLDPDLAAALEKVLDVRFEFQDVGPFANVLPGLLDKKYDIGMSGITDTREREQGVDKNNKQVNDGVDFVDYFMAGFGMAVAKGNPEKISKLDDLCGKSLVVKKGTIHEDLATRQQKACEHLGKPLRILPANADVEAVADLHGGQVDAYLTDYPKALYNVQTVDGGQAFDIAGPQFQPRPYGIAVRKGDSVLRDVLTKAMNSLVRDSTYAGILEKRQLTAGAIQNSVVNGSS
ncbi:ABC transporter substrate-binding protein [Kitasatospora atroaurantiaca]|uniref:Amino acid ABC transporter substrate-binding protein (PAAT family) n=1 Tax=Kitasatospora atroaurantiaca TaxID=285545 RepID=A0A561EKY6_9ACTN|nr:ABC transporter substrate-binding protein [Kitasatospora atroaurantiaca]TWE16274.1 amino acid ABC transporter substrate-binding protein (PAAT family) [Kitasatospora atroaurantiaca]